MAMNYGCTAINLLYICSCRCSVCLHLPMHSDIKNLFGVFCIIWCLWLPIQRYCNSLLDACDCGVICSSLSIACMCVVPWKCMSGKDYFVWYRNPQVCLLVKNKYYTVTEKKSFLNIIKLKGIKYNYAVHCKLSLMAQ
jgi:hypothetical protein